MAARCCASIGAVSASIIVHCVRGVRMTVRVWCARCMYGGTLLRLYWGGECFDYRALCTWCAYDRTCATSAHNSLTYLAAKYVAHG